MRFLTFMSIVADIQRNFILQHGLFLRGGITIGTLSFNDDYIFGQGLIDSVALEEAAIYPRIVIGQAALDYILQPHFIKQEDLKKASEIEDRAHAGEQISDEELVFCNSILPSANMEKFYLEWRNHLVFRTSDGEVVLNYLYCFDINTMIDKTTMEQLLQFLKVVSPSDYQVLTSINLDQKPRLEQHKILLTQKVNEFGKYDNLDISAVKKAEVQEHILKKYLWALSFHNYVCEVYRFPDCVIRPYIGCDVRFMRMTAEIPEDKST